MTSHTAEATSEDAILDNGGQSIAPLARKSGRYRVFISYSHSDRALAEQIAALLDKNDLEPMWDRNFAFGQGFHEQIQLYIAHAHVFLPLLTAKSDARKWVHQEIGYAMALCVPVLPVAVGKVPGGMLQQIHALTVERDSLGELRVSLTPAVIARLLNRQTHDSALYTCADFPDSASFQTGGVGQEYRGKGFNLAQWCPEYDWVAHNGYENFGAWIG